MLVRRLIYLASLALASGVLGYGIALRTAGGVDAPAPVAVAPAVPSATGSAVDWARLTEQDLRVAPIFVAAYQKGVEAALDSLVALAARDPDVQRNGHHLAHAVGRVGITAADDDPTVLARCRPLFQAGCYHGVLEGYLASVSEVDARELAGFCAELDEPGKAVIDARECAHGLGHGLIDRFAYDFGAALGACDAFRDDAFREECHDGIFMQNLVMGQGLPSSTAAAESAEAAEHEHAAAAPVDASAGAHEHGGAAPGVHYAAAGFREDDLAFPCNTVDESYQDSCWSYQPVAIRQFTGDPGPRTLVACDLAAEPARERCYAGYGKQTLGRYDNDQQVLIDLCSLALPPYDEACLGGVVELLIDREWGPESAFGFCRRVASFGRDPTSCYATLGERIVLFHASPAETEAVCARAPEPRFAEACRSGAEG